MLWPSWLSYFFLIIFTISNNVVDAQLRPRLLENKARAEDVLRRGSCENNNTFIEPFKIPKTYPLHELPTSRNDDCNFEKLSITIGLRIRNIRGVDDVNERLTMEVDFFTAWRDHLLADLLDNETDVTLEAKRGSKYIALHPSFIKKIWHPTIIFSRTISITKPTPIAEQFENEPVRILLFPEGHVELYTRLILTLYCPMDFKYFPFDTQICNVAMRSYSLTDADIELAWHNASRHKNSSDVEKKPVVYFFDRAHPNYRIYLHGVTTRVAPELDSLNKPENWTYLRFSLSVKRKLTFHIVQTFIPITFLVIITWLTFFIPLSNLEARIAVAMTTLLTMTNKLAEVGTYTPNVSYITAMDFYMFVSISIVFLTLFEFTLLYWLRMGRTEYAQSRVSLRKKLPANNSRETSEFEEPTWTIKMDPRVFLRIRNYVEVYGFLLTIFVFIVFNIFFWPWMLVNSDYFVENVDPDYNDVP